MLSRLPEARGLQLLWPSFLFTTAASPPDAFCSSPPFPAARRAGYRLLQAAACSRRGHSHPLRRRRARESFPLWTGAPSFPTPASQCALSRPQARRPPTGARSRRPCSGFARARRIPRLWRAAGVSRSAAFAAGVLMATEGLSADAAVEAVAAAHPAADPNEGFRAQLRLFGGPPHPPTPPTTAA